MFRSQSSDHHHGSITALVQLLLMGVHASSYSGMWLYVVCASVHTMYLSVWCLVMYCTEITAPYDVDTIVSEEPADTISRVDKVPHLH